MIVFLLLRPRRSRTLAIDSLKDRLRGGVGYYRLCVSIGTYVSAFQVRSIGTRNARAISR